MGCTFRSVIIRDWGWLFSRFPELVTDLCQKSVMVSLAALTSSEITMQAGDHSQTSKPEFLDELNSDLRLLYWVMCNRGFFTISKAQK